MVSRSEIGLGSPLFYFILSAASFACRATLRPVSESSLSKDSPRIFFLRINLSSSRFLKATFFGGDSFLTSSLLGFCS